jgi:hypothetical protein
VVNSNPRLVYHRERGPVPTVHEDGWAPGPVQVDAENIAPTGIRSPERPAGIESLYRLRFPGQRAMVIHNKRCVDKGVTGSCLNCPAATP